MNVLILGGGFGGVYAYLKLQKELLRADKKAKITWVTKDDKFLFLPLIHEVATGNLLPSGVTQPIRVFPLNCPMDFVQAEVTEIDFDKQIVFVQDANGNKQLSYDKVILALGSDTNFYDVPGAKECSLTLKSLTDAKLIKDRMIEALDSAAGITDENEQKKQQRFVIVGGGPTGVELAGEMLDYVNYELCKVFGKHCRSTEVIIVQSADRLVPQVDNWFSVNAQRILEKSGAEILLNTKVTEISAETVKTTNGKIEAKTVIWTAGVKAREIKLSGEKNIQQETRSARIKVNEYLQIPEYKDVYVVGDMAWVCDREAGQPYPMRAQFAVRQGQLAAENILRSVKDKQSKEFYWKDQGFIISLGDEKALAQVKGLKFKGFPAWWMYRTAYLFKLVGLKAKLRTAFEWTLNLFLPRDVSKFN